MGVWFYYNFAAGSLTQKDFVEDYSINMTYSQKRQICFLSHHLGELDVALHL